MQTIAPASAPPLDGLTILAVEQYGAGPFGSMLLSDLGARVIKIESPDGGDVGRHVGPFHHDDGESLFFHAFNRNKQSLALDLKSAAGQAVLHDLAREADAVFDNLRGDLPDKLGLTHARLGAVNPAIVCVHLSAYGREGPRRDWPGYDYLMQAEAGYLSLTGEPGSPPSRFGLSVVDLMTGLMAAFALAGGVIGARATGRGRDLDVSLFDTALHNLGYLATWYLQRGHAQTRVARSGHPSLSPSQLYSTSDGWIFVMCNKEKFWPALCSGLGRPEMAQDPRFVDFGARLANREALTAELDAVFGTRTTAEWLERLSGTVPVAPVNDMAQALGSAFALDARASVASVPTDAGSDVRLLRSPIRFADAPAPTGAPALGRDSAAILGAMGYPAERIAALMAQKVVAGPLPARAAPASADPDAQRERT